MRQYMSIRSSSVNVAWLKPRGFNTQITIYARILGVAASPPTLNVLEADSWFLKHDL